jgi:hypothetical protein
LVLRDPGDLVLLPDARRARGAVIAVTLNFYYLLFFAMLSLYISASVRVSNCLSAGDASAARRAAAGLHSWEPSEVR